jgi:dTDP-glucose 4,6-dehydratase
MNSSIVVTGAAGFIGSNFVLEWMREPDSKVISFDKLTYAGNLRNLLSLNHDPRHIFIKGDIADRASVRRILTEHQPQAILHFAAETHVDRSIHGPEAFIQANVVGTFVLLEESVNYFRDLPQEDKTHFRFLHVSTDEVYGSLGANDPGFTESSPYAPNSPYSASKAGSDHLVRAYHHTYGLPTLTTNCSNNYGPFQFPEKLIPLVIHNALSGKPLPVYGDGLNVRDWLFVLDHCSAIRRVLERGRPGETYNIGGGNEKTNLEVAHTLCDILDSCRPRLDGSSYRGLITFVKDRAGHDRRYAINASKILTELGWSPGERFDTGVQKTVEWYLANQNWTESILSGEYLKWIETQYGVSDGKS